MTPEVRRIIESIEVALAELATTAPTVDPRIDRIRAVTRPLVDHMHGRRHLSDEEIELRLAGARDAFEELRPDVEAALAALGEGEAWSRHESFGGGNLPTSRTDS